jgi:GNAT superfamily N-acetyltransferase
MIKLDKKDYKNVMNLTKNLEENCTFGYGVILNNMPGRVFVDNLSNPQSCFIACDGGKYMVVGNEGNEKFNTALVEYLKQEQNHKIYYDFYASSEKWIEMLSKRLEGHSIPLPRTIYAYRGSEGPVYSKLCSELEDGYELKQMDENLFNELVTKIDSTYLNQWGSAEAFVSKGLGYCVLHEGKIASICYCVVAGGGYAELSIYTMEKYRNRNFARITCSAFVEECINRNLTTIWDAGSDNGPSNKLALKLGFSKEKEAKLIFWHENHDIIQGYIDGKNFM